MLLVDIEKPIDCKYCIFSDKCLECIGIDRKRNTEKCLIKGEIFAKSLNEDKSYTELTRESAERL